ncbi:glycosyltransferase [Chloroflexi bacterium TSY]|nr:glycosyltransferase [Chloroflexi bacterium TSY]
MWINKLSIVLVWFYALDRLLKLFALIQFFNRSSSKPTFADEQWPSVTLLQPITRGATNLAQMLDCRAQLDYPGSIQHLLLCDASDYETLDTCRIWLATQSHLAGRLIPVSANNQHSASHADSSQENEWESIAPKTDKLLAGLPMATGDILCFVDDDVALPIDALQVLIQPLYSQKARNKEVGATFGLARYRSWHNLWSSLMSVFVNANALFSYVPLSYLTEPFTITGHCFAIKRNVFDAIGGLTGMEKHFDDDHELARRIRRSGLRCVQTPLIYDVENDLASWEAYHKQMKRWFTMPRVAMIPFLTRYEKLVMLISSLGNFIPPLVGLLSFISLLQTDQRQKNYRPLQICLLVLIGAYSLSERLFLQRTMPIKHWPLLIVAGFIIPLQVFAALLGNDEFEWRGQRWRAQPGGGMDYLGDSKERTNHRLTG